mmetsp:Transcript_43612/g.98592  ORF Transcript_43612/g.98592 Transcript_43612/m.98592 type:complete len:167 (+) Transcript_43612:179-679(+)|eukprot:CAMPEP_0172594356 /NCGR_PEP_ID=MMETSP1068-20121228/13740_1 /TAXON_ID=35684 /ORGANISM="Pseudopedinella elastica, Strain CCMP716" /LENGTH=166 /DNA_ID=CAMNT_0013392353 /DNA_START=151 /DNA_END=651 /DNA_ORIENTATION=-
MKPSLSLPILLTALAGVAVPVCSRSLEAWKVVQAQSSWSRVSRGGAEGPVEEPQTMMGLNAMLSSAGPDTLVVIDFGATWCGPCRAIAPEFERLAWEHAPALELSEGMSPPVLFIKVDVDKIPEAARKFDVSSLPTFLFIKQDEELERFSGADLKRLTTSVEEYRS